VWLCCLPLVSLISRYKNGKVTVNSVDGRLYTDTRPCEGAFRPDRENPCYVGIQTLILCTGGWFLWNLLLSVFRPFRVAAKVLTVV